jgi:hypothetical protein
MQKQFIVTAILLTSLWGLSPSANAETLHHRQQHQAGCIQHGLASGRLTLWEGAMLRQEQVQLRYLRTLFGTNGDLSQIERRILENRLDLASEHIYRFTHNPYRAERPVSCSRDDHHRRRH